MVVHEAKAAPIQPVIIRIQETQMQLQRVHIAKLRVPIQILTQLHAPTQLLAPIHLQVLAVEVMEDHPEAAVDVLAVAEEEDNFNQKNL